MTTKTDIIFINIDNNKIKLQTICETVQRHFILNQRILLAVPNQTAAQYLDELLWRMPEESFLPHRIISKPSNDCIAITESQENLNQAEVLFNLRPNASSLFDQYRILYELFDHTSPEKKELSERRIQAYPYNILVQAESENSGKEAVQNFYLERATLPLARRE